MKFLARRVFWHFFSKNRFPTNWSDHLEFLRKMQKCIYLINIARKSDFDEFFLPPGYPQSNLALFAKNHIHAIIGGHLEFLRKLKKSTFIL